MGLQVALVYSYDSQGCIIVVKLTFILEAISTRKTPKNQSWNLASGNRLALAGAKCLDYMHILNMGDHKFFLFNFKQAASVPWIIGVSNPTIVLFLCHLHASLTDYDLARELLHHGIQLHTFLSLPCICPSPPIPISVPIWLAHYEFISKDYHIYIQQRCALLADPQVAQAALMQGGIVWHLAIATLNFDNVLYGPTTAATLYYQGVTLKTKDSPIKLCDDGLSQLGYDIICGLHHCYTGKCI